VHIPYQIVSLDTRSRRTQTYYKCLIPAQPRYGPMRDTFEGTKVSRCHADHSVANFQVLHVFADCGDDTRAFARTRHIFSVYFAT
jgi:hypothetical protein